MQADQDNSTPLDEFNNLSIEETKNKLFSTKPENKVSFKYDFDANNMSPLSSIDSDYVFVLDSNISMASPPPPLEFTPSSYRFSLQHQKDILEDIKKNIASSPTVSKTILVDTNTDNMPRNDINKHNAKIKHQETNTVKQTIKDIIAMVHHLIKKTYQKIIYLVKNRMC